jgi:hypothetical protein
MGLQREKAGRGSLAMYTQVILFSRRYRIPRLRCLPPQLLWATTIERVLFHTRTSFLSVVGTIIILSAALWVAVSVPVSAYGMDLTLVPQFSKEQKPVDVENRLEGDRITASGMNTPEIVDGASQVPLSRSLGRARGQSTVLTLSTDSAVPISSSRVRRSSVAKDGAGIQDRDTSMPADATPSAQGRQIRPGRSESGMSVRSTYTVRENIKYRQEEQEQLIPQASGN